MYRNTTDATSKALSDVAYRLLSSSKTPILDFLLTLTYSLVPLPNVTGPYTNSTVPVPLGRYRSLINDRLKFQALLASTPTVAACEPPSPTIDPNFNPHNQILYFYGKDQVEVFKVKTPYITRDMRNGVFEAALWGAQLGFAAAILLVLMMANHRREDEKKETEEDLGPILKDRPPDTVYSQHFEDEKKVPPDDEDPIALETSDTLVTYPADAEVTADEKETGCKESLEKKKDRKAAKKALRWNPAYPLSIIAIFLVICRSIVHLSWFWSPFYEFFAMYTHDATIISSLAKVRLCLGMAFDIILNCVLYFSMFFQLRSAMGGDMVGEERPRSYYIWGYIFQAAFTSAGAADVVLHACVIRDQWVYLKLPLKVAANRSLPFGETVHMAHKILVCFIVSCFSAVCLAKLGPAFRTIKRQFASWMRTKKAGFEVPDIDDMRHKMGIMQIMFVLTFQSMAIPVILTFLEAFKKVRIVTSLIPALISFSLPLCNIWIRLNALPPKVKTKNCKVCKRLHVVKQRGWKPTHLPGNLDPDDDMRRIYNPSRYSLASDLSHSTCPGPGGEDKVEGESDCKHAENKKESPVSLTVARLLSDEHYFASLTPKQIAAHQISRRDEYPQCWTDYDMRPIPQPPEEDEAEDEQQYDCDCYFEDEEGDQTCDCDCDLEDEEEGEQTRDYDSNLEDDPDPHTDIPPHLCTTCTCTCIYCDLDFLLYWFPELDGYLNIPYPIESPILPDFSTLDHPNIPFLIRELTYSCHDLSIYSSCSPTRRPDPDDDISAAGPSLRGDIAGMGDRRGQRPTMLPLDRETKEMSVAEGKKPVPSPWSPPPIYSPGEVPPYSPGMVPPYSSPALDGVMERALLVGSGRVQEVVRRV